MNITRIALLGATGSIGKQALEIVRDNPDRLAVVGLTAQHRVRDLVALCHEFRPKLAVIADETLYSELKEGIKGLPTRALTGEEGLCQAATLQEADIVLSSLVGITGLLPTLAAIEEGKTIALANKEVLVAGGECITEAASKYNVRILPVDSEHSAIYQCLLGERQKPEKIWLTASGGPFFKCTEKEFDNVTPAQALNHPRWLMGPKVTIDSATLANKGFEMIEARWLFDVPAKAIEVVVHPQSIVHSMVCFRDGSVKAQLSPPDMRLPIGFALGLGERIPNNYPRIDLFSSEFNFFKPDFVRFPMLSFAYKVLELGGNASAIFNAADSVAVEAFLEGRIAFSQIAILTEALLAKDFYSPKADLETIVETDLRVTAAAREMLSKFAC